MSAAPTVLLTGSTGFIGSAIARRLSHVSDLHLRRLVRTTGGLPDGSLVVGDLRDEASVRAAMTGVDVVIHAASYVGPDQGLAWNVNDYGTRLLVHAAQSASVGTIISISTAAVYGTGPHHEVVEGQITPHPESEASRSRLVGEQHVLNAGGLVLRPNLVHGLGDRVFIPGLMKLFTRLGAWVDSGAARVSTIDVNDLAQLAVAFALCPPSGHGHVLHANHPTPMTVRHIFTNTAGALGIPTPTRSLTYEQALQNARAPDFPFSPRQLSLVALEHTYDSTQAWTLAGLDPREPFHLNADAIAWYCQQMARVEQANVSSAQAASAEPSPAQ